MKGNPMAHHGHVSKIALFALALTLGTLLAACGDAHGCSYSNSGTCGAANSHTGADVSP